MKLLYWNLKANKNETYIASLIQEHNIDIAIFSEHKNTDFSVLVNDLLSDEYEFYSGYGGCEKVIMVAKKDIHIEINREQSRYVMYSALYGNDQYIIVGVHLPANPRADANDRKMVIRDLLVDLKEQEKIHHHSNSIIIGDLNSSPFDEELIEKDAFNAVLYKTVIQQKEHIIHQGKQFRFLYNPILHYISENNHQYGSFYYSGGINPLYWYCYDQILMTKDLIGSFKEMQYCQSIHGKSLLKKVRPDDSISDHLPLMVTFERSGKNE